MSVDDAITSAVRQAVAEAEQPPQVADRLLAWLNALSSGATDIERPADVAQYLDTVLHAVSIRER